MSGGGVLVTGAGRGIGAAIARRLADDGWRVAVSDVDPETAEATAASIDGAIAVPGDVSDERQAAELVAVSAERLGGLRGLVNNAGIERRAPLADYDEQTWDDVLAVNATGPFLVTRAAAPYLRQADDAAVVTIGSTAVIGLTGQVGYDASKGALRGILDYNTEPLVSIDFNHCPASCTFDATQTAVVDGALARVMGWYDNEWGFSCRMSDTAVLFGSL